MLHLAPPAVPPYRTASDAPAIGGEHVPSRPTEGRLNFSSRSCLGQVCFILLVFIGELYYRFHHSVGSNSNAPSQNRGSLSRARATADCGMSVSGCSCSGLMVCVIVVLLGPMDFTVPHLLPSKTATSDPQVVPSRDRDPSERDKVCQLKFR